MTWHWWHVALSWGATLGAFAALAGAAAWRHRAAKRELARLEQRGRSMP
jgi:heme exporter protein CcmD